MASSWASSWGISWLNSWGAAAAPAADVRQPGGWLPKKYVRDGKIYDRPDYEPPQDEPESLPPQPIPADLVNALRYGPVFDPFPALQQEIRLLKQQARHMEAEMQAEDDLVTVLLLSS